MIDDRRPVIALIWEGDIPAPEIVEATLADIEELYDNGLASPADLMFHHVFLSDDHDQGPGVFVYGKEGCDAFFCEYQPVINPPTIETKGRARRVTARRRTDLA